MPLSIITYIFNSHKKSSQKNEMNLKAFKWFCKDLLFMDIIYNRLCIKSILIKHALSRQKDLGRKLNLEKSKGYIKIDFMIDKFLMSFIPLFVAFDVLGILPIYIKFTAHLDAKKRGRQLRDSILTSFFTTLLFVVIGNHVLQYLGIAIRDFFIAGGVVLFIIAVKDIVMGHSEPIIEDDMFGVVPLGVPLLAGPAVLATSIIVRNNYGFYFFLISLLTNLIICWIILKFSEFILKYLGKKFIEALSKVFALVIASIAVMFIRKGLTG